MSTVKHAMWAERHRPKTLDECVLEILSPQQHQWLMKFANEKIAPLPNILFFGPPGTGKTTVARLLASEDRCTLSEINASLMGVDLAREVEDFFRSGSIFCNQRVFLLDEVDGLTKKAQLALRAMMEARGSKTGWLMTCNIRSALIDPLRSRLVEINFSFPSRENQPRHKLGLVRRCREILDAEGISGVSDEAIMRIVDTHYPDVRQIVNYLQMEFETAVAA